MRTDNLAFANANESERREPRLTIAIHFDDIAFDIVYLTSHTDAATPDIATAVIAGCIENYSGQSQRIDPAAGNAEIGNITFSAVDINGQLTTELNTRLQAGTGLRLKKVVYHAGFAGMDWDDYEVVHTMIMDGKKGVGYRGKLYDFDTSDIQRQAKRRIFDSEQLFLNGAIGASDKKVPVTGSDITVFQTVEHDGQYAAHPNQAVGYVKIDKEIIAHTGMSNDATLGTVIDVLQRGALGTLAVPHDVDLSQPAERRPKVEEFIYLEGAFPKLAYALWTGDLYGQSGATLPDHWHAGVDPAFVRLSDYTGIGDDYWETTTAAGLHLRFEGLKKQEAKRFIEKELMLYNCFMPIYSDGTVGLKRLASVLADAPHVMVLDESNIVSYGSLEWDFSALINDILLQWNYLDVKGDFTKTNRYLDVNSIDKHGGTDTVTFKLLGLHTGANTEEDLINLVDTVRDRYSGPPMRLSVQVLPSRNRLEVGDVVRVRLPQITDLVSGAALDRSFEIQRTNFNRRTGRLMLELFASSQRAGELVRTTQTSVLDDDFYDATKPLAGEVRTDLASILTINAGVITANATLPGHETDNRQAIYCYDGDLTLQDGVTLTWTQNIQLRIKGDWVVNGIFTGKGNGATGGTGMDAFNVGGQASNATAGEAGGFGVTRSYAGYMFLIPSFGPSAINAVFNTGPHDTVFPLHFTALPNFSLTNNGNALVGLPRNLRGTGGSGGGGVVRQVAIPPLPSTDIVAFGGDGGAGGGGLVMIARGYSYGPNGKIDSSGDAGVDGSTPNTPDGAGGSPGAVLAMIDGNASPFNLREKHIADLGASVPPIISDGLFEPTRQHYFAIGTGFDGGDMSESAGRVQYVPSQVAVVEEIINPLEVKSFTALQNGDSVVFRWEHGGDLSLLAGFDIRYGKRGASNYDDATPLTRTTKGTNITSKDVPPGDWSFFIKPISLDANLESITAVSTDLVVISSLDIIFQQQQAPEWSGALTNFVRHHTGVLVPSSQSVNADIGWRVFDEFVPDPHLICTYEAPEIDIDFDDNVRVWAEIDSALGPGESSGVADPALQVDYRLESGAYDGFENFSIGDVRARFFKHNLVLDTSKGVAKITGFLPTVDLLEHTINAKDIDVPAGGTTIVFSTPFHIEPFVRALIKGSTPLHVAVDNITENGFDVELFTVSGATTSGTIDWEATGV